MFCLCYKFQGYSQYSYFKINKISKVINTKLAIGNAPGNVIYENVNPVL